MIMTVGNVVVLLCDEGHVVDTIPVSEWAMSATEANEHERTRSCMCATEAEALLDKELLHAWGQYRYGSERIEK